MLTDVSYRRLGVHPLSAGGAVDGPEPAILPGPLYPYEKARLWEKVCSWLVMNSSNAARPSWVAFLAR